jgi:ATP-binding cassette subfamily B protein
MKGRTVVIIAHRLSTIADVDTIVTLKRGRVDEIGSPKQLATTGGIYAQLLKLQSGSAKVAESKLKNFDIAS